MLPVKLGHFSFHTPQRHRRFVEMTPFSYKVPHHTTPSNAGAAQVHYAATDAVLCVCWTSGESGARSVSPENVEMTGAWSRTASPINGVCLQGGATAHAKAEVQKSDGAFLSRRQVCLAWW